MIQDKKKMAKETRQKRENRVMHHSTEGTERARGKMREREKCNTKGERQQTEGGKRAACEGKEGTQKGTERGRDEDKE